MSISFILIGGFVLDLLLGDPAWLPHLVVGIGWVISGLETVLRQVFPATPRGERLAGAILALTVAGGAYGLTHGVLALAERLHPALAAGVAVFLCFQTLATRGLREAAMGVYRELGRGDLAGARRAVGMIVGRDAKTLDRNGIIRATVETVAENASDGVVAPILFFAIGGAPLAVFYKAVNTMDSMLGYRNDRYRYFGTAAARLDDVVNFVPARLTAFLLAVSAGMCEMDWRGAFRIWWRDGGNHTSPNAGRPEAACAGALGIRLGGDALYGGRLVSKPTIGDATREMETEDIVRACRLLYGAAFLAVLLCGVARMIVGAHS